MDEQASQRELHEEIRERAIGLLARREHSVRELVLKLMQRDFPRDVIDEVARELVEEGLLSDARFTEEFVRSRYNQGYGPVRIRAELAKKGVDDVYVGPHLKDMDFDWPERAREVRIRRFGEHGPESMRERQKQVRFLVNRGFTQDQIRRALEDAEPE